MKKIRLPHFNKLKNYFSKENLFALRFLPKVLSRIDKTILVLGLIAILLGIFFIGRNYWLKNTQEEPNFGGTYTEGIVGEAKDLDKHLARLTGAGLTRLVENGDVQGDLAESWEILDDGKTYQFKLRPGYSSQDFADQLINKNIWSNIEIATPADNLITFKFKQPFSPFLYISTEPVFPYGPYKITKEEKDRLTLTAQDTYWQGKPYIGKIVINLYSNYTSLYKAAQHHEIMGYLQNSQGDYQISDSKIFNFTLPRDLILFFNLSKSNLQDVNIRRNLKDNKPLDKDLNLELATSDTEKNIASAEDLKNKWVALKVNLTIKKYDNVTLQKEIIPKRTYDLLLYGLDYGPDPDPYPFWHSSQIKPEGMNLSNFSNKKSDKLLEEARQTFDFKVRQDKYNQFQQILDQEVPFIILNKESCFYVVSNEIKGITKIFGSAESDRFLNVNQWYIKSKRVKK